MFKIYQIYTVYAISSLAAGNPKFKYDSEFTKSLTNVVSLGEIVSYNLIR